MDDFVLWSGDKETLRLMLEKIQQYTTLNLKLTLKQPVMGKTANGLPFLGFLIKNSGVYLLAKSKRRVKNRLKSISYCLAAETISEQKASQRLLSIFTAISLARTNNFRYNLMHRGFFGLEPRFARRQLEQQCAEHAFLLSE
jgi:hypothetical protein